MSNKVMKVSDLPIEEQPQADQTPPWQGKLIASLTNDGELDKPEAEFVAIGYPHLSRRVDSNGDVTYAVNDAFPKFSIEPLGYVADLQCVICKVGKKNAGTPAKA